MNITTESCNVTDELPIAHGASQQGMEALEETVPTNHELTKQVVS